MLILSCVEYIFFFFFFKQKTAYEMRISDWSSDVCSSDLHGFARKIAGLPVLIQCGFVTYVFRPKGQARMRGRYGRGRKRRSGKDSSCGEPQCERRNF